MKSRTSSFNVTVFKKDLTRFAPCWGAYLTLLVLVLVTVAGESHPYYRVQNIQSAIVAMAWVNLIYAAVVAQLLFGDLYNSRLCNALHAMPVTRDGWFVTHSAAGLAFSLLPNLVVALLALPVLRLEIGWSAVFWWLLSAEMSYIFYFGTAVLCIMLSGNRLGQLAIYAMISFAGLAAAWLATAIYEPLLYGIQINMDAFYPFCPLASFSQRSRMLVIDKLMVEDEFGNFMYYQLLSVAPGEGWGYLTICAVIGLLTLTAAMVLYRKRRLECAGDFVAFKPMEPVVQVLVTLFAGGFFHIFGDVFGLRGTYVLVFCGMVFGYFACRMLLMRTNRVFQKRAFLGCGAILAVFGLTLALTVWDPAGITRWVPELQEVESVTFSETYSMSQHNEWPFVATEASDIEALLEVHEDCITREASSQPGGTAEQYYTMSLRLEYKLKNGKTVNRFYDIYPGTEAGQILKGYYTRPECVLGFREEQAPMMTKYIRSIYVDGMGEQQYDLENLDLEGMMDAILADCRAGNMAKNRAYHYPNNYDTLGGDYDMGVCYLEIDWDHERMGAELKDSGELYDIISYSSIRVYRSCTNTLNWLEENGLLTDDLKRELVEKYGGAYATFTTGNYTLDNMLLHN